LTGILKIARIYGYWFGPAHLDQKQGYGPNGVKVFYGIQRQAAGGFGRRIAKKIGHIAVGHLMKGDSHKHWNGQDGQLLDKGCDIGHGLTGYHHLLFWASKIGGQKTGAPGQAWQEKMMKTLKLF
jgi:hypothetical protein